MDGILRMVSAGLQHVPGLILVGATLMVPAAAGAQGLTGALTATVKDEQGGVLPGARVTLSSPALIGGPLTATTNDRGHVRFPVLAPGTYTLVVELPPRFAPYRVANITIGAGMTLDWTPVLRVAGVAESLVVEGGSLIGARESGFDDAIRPGAAAQHSNAPLQHVRHDSVGARRVGHVAFQRHRQHRLLVRVGRQREPVPHRRHELHVPVPGRVARRAERGRDSGNPDSVDGRVGRVRQHAGRRLQRRHQTRRRLSSSSTRRTTGSRPRGRVSRSCGPSPTPADGRAGTSASGTATSRPASAARSCAIGSGSSASYQYQRDYDSQPGADPAFPRTYEQNKVSGKLTWRLTPSMQLMQSYHQEFWVNPTQATAVTPFEATFRHNASVPSMTFGHFTHTLSPTTVWEARVGRYVLRLEHGSRARAIGRRRTGSIASPMSRAAT